MSVLTSKLIVALVDQVTAPARAVASTIKHLDAASRANAMAMNEMRGKMVDAAAAAYALGQAVFKPVEAAMAFESAMADVAKVTSFDDMGLAEFGADLRRLSTSEIPMAVNELAELAENAAASGIADNDLLDFTRMTAKAALAWGVTGGQAGEDLAKIKEALRLNIDETMLYADAINHLSDRTASTAPDLTRFARNVAAQGEFFGFTREESLAFGSAMISAGAEVEVAATSFRNMGRALTIGTSATKRQRDGFKALGLSAEQVATDMQKDAVGTTLEVIQALGKVPKEAQAAVMSQLFGDEARALAPLLTDLGLLEKTLGYVADETDYAGSVNDEFAKRAETSAFNVQRFKNQIDGIAISVGNALLPAMNSVLETIGPMMQAFADFAAEHPNVVLALVSITGALVALRVAATAGRWAFLFLKGGVVDAALTMAKSAATFMALINPLNLVKNAMTALRVAMMASGIGLVLAGVAAAGTWIYNNWEGLTSFFQGFGEAFMGAIEPILPVLQPLVDAGKAMLDWVTGLLGPVEASNAEWKSWGQTVGKVVGEAVLTVVNKGAEIIAWFRDLPGHVTNGIAGLVDAVADAFANIGQLVADAFANIDWVGIGVSLMNSIWEGMKTIIPAMLNGLGDAIASLNPFGGGPQGSDNPSAIINDVADPGIASPYLGVDGAKAAGGSILGGKTYLVGEYGPELVTPGRSGWVHDAGTTAGMLGGGRAAPSITVQIGDIILQAVNDPERTAEMVLQKINEKLGDALGGIHADIEFEG